MRRRVAMAALLGMALGCDTAVPVGAWSSGSGALCSAGPASVVTAGEESSCAVTQDGSLWCWGKNHDGQIGPAGKLGGNSTVPLRAMTGVRMAVCADDFVCAIDVGGSMYCFGENNYGQLGQGTTSTGSPMPMLVAGGPVWRTVSSRGDSICAVQVDGSLWCWGQNATGQLGLGPNGPGRVSAPTKVASDVIWKDVSAGTDHTCALAADGRLFCFGLNTNGQLGTGDMRDRDTPTEIAGGPWHRVQAGVKHTCALDEGGHLFCWGANAAGQLGTGDRTRRLVPTPVGTSDGWVTVALADNYTCATDRDRHLWCWGGTSDDQPPMGTGDVLPARLPGTWREVSMHVKHGCGIDGAGHVACWGDNGDGELGLGDLTDRAAPTLLCGGP